MSHSLGPWHYEAGRVWRNGDYEDAVAYVDNKDDGSLIAAAPQLHDSLKELLEICRWKCSPLDEQLLPNKTNHDAMLDACDILDKIRNV